MFFAHYTMKHINLPWALLTARLGNHHLQTNCLHILLRFLCRGGIQFALRRGEEAAWPQGAPVPFSYNSPLRRLYCRRVANWSYYKVYLWTQNSPTSNQIWKCQVLSIMRTLSLSQKWKWRASRADDDEVQTPTAASAWTSPACVRMNGCHYD